jgi:hypothetical protein
MARPPITKARPYTPQSGAFKGRTFHTERQYRDALAREKGYRSWHEQQRAAKKVSPKSFETLRPRAKQARAEALDALAKMRHGASLTRAAKEAGTTPNTVIRYVGDQLHHEGGRVVASPSDRLFRRVQVATIEGAQWVDVRGSRQASLAGQHANAVKAFLSAPDDASLEIALRNLQKFEGVTVGGKQLETRPEVLEELGRRGELEFEGPLSG